MSIAPTPSFRSTSESEAEYVGARMTVDAFLDIPDGGHFYELVDGVVIMSPSPTPKHQRVAMRIAYLIGDYLEKNPVGELFAEIDVHLGKGPQGGDLVYRPELVFIRSERMAGMEERIIGAPDMVLEVISRGSRRIDTGTKKDDFERFGVREYWLADPAHKTIVFID
ncbi:MAG: Uma2 family endonuclease [Planctomycetes bacterium]|nr:Uma2 family endonuclease [Planctomycetota bacterium]